MKSNSTVLYVKSHFVQVLRCRDKAIVWHSLFGHPKIISRETLGFIELFSTPGTIDSKFGEKIRVENRRVIRDLQSSYILVPQDFDERAFLEESISGQRRKIINGELINYLELIMSEECNFRCVYCIHFNNLCNSDRVKAPIKFMRFDVAKKAIDEYLQILRNHKKTVAEINFGGGEPLLVWPVIKQVLDYCITTYCAEFDFHFSINTNLSLITREIAYTLKKFDVRIDSSLDGLREGNDCVRITKSGKGTFKRIIRGFETLEESGYPLHGFAVTINEKNFYQLDRSIVDFVKSRGMKSVRIDVDVVGMVMVPVSSIITKLIEIRNYAKEQGIDIPGFWSRPVENMNESSLNGQVSFCGAVRGNSLCVI